MKKNHNGEESLNDKQTLLQTLFYGWRKEGRIRWGLVFTVILSFVITFIIIVISVQLNLPRFSLSTKAFEVGKPAPSDFVVVRNGITYVDKKATSERREASAKLIPPIFNYNLNLARKSLEDFDVFYTIFDSALKAGDTKEMIFAHLQFNFPEIVDSIGAKEVAAILSLSPNHIEVFDKARKLLEEVMSLGVYQGLDEMKYEDPDLFASGQITLIRENDERVPLEKALSSGDVQNFIDDKIKPLLFNELSKSLVILLVNTFAQENCFYNKTLTLARKEEARIKTPPVRLTLPKNHVVIYEGDVVTEEDMEKIRAHGESDFSISFNTYMGTGLYLFLVYFFVFYMLNREIIKSSLSSRQGYLFLFLGLFYLLLGIFLTRFDLPGEHLPLSVLMPTGTMAILVTILISPLVGVVFSLAVSLLLLLVTNMDVNVFFFAFLSGAAGSAVTLNTRRSIDLIRSGIYLAVINSLILILIGLINTFTRGSAPAFMPSDLLSAIAWGLGNGFLCGIFSLGFMPLMEHFLNTATRFRLMELSDLNSPIFKKMLTQAPGTYNHSVFIANLAESVCNEIGANPLLARVGAYYHDIGKIDQAEYFIENQRSYNKHDELKPSLSAAIIKSHVKLGIEKAQELKLPEEVVDIIAQHHGKGLIAFFYQRAIAENSNVATSDFSYTTPRPQTKEAAVVMLADVVEAASRTLKRPTVGKLEKFIWGIIMDKFNDGELSESNLTLNDLEIIKNKFVKLMAGHFHSRIEYPKIKEGVK